MSESFKIIVATHKKYRMPEDSIYIPLHVGAEGKTDENGNPLDLGYQKDNVGDNISIKNPNYCELTGLYWLWKNVQADNIGLVHYRRYFVSGSSGDKWKRIANQECLLEQLRRADVILPPKRHYYIESTYNQYIHAHHAEDLDLTRNIICEKYPDYIATFDKCMRRTSGHRFNMFVMRHDVADSYCQWLFDILFELEKRLNISGYSKNDARVFGFVAERILDVWIETNNIKFKEMPVLFMEKQNWLIKGGKFVLRKFGIRK